MSRWFRTHVTHARLRELASLTGLLFAVCWVRFADLDARSFWFDEAFSLELATNCSVKELLDRTGRDVHPPFYYLVLKCWMWFAPRTEAGVRSLSAVMGVCGVCGYYGVLRAWLRCSRQAAIRDCAPRIAWWSAALLGFNAQHVYWSREARMYTMGVLLTMVSAALMPGVLLKRQFFRGVAYSVVAALLMLTHNYGLFTVAAEALCIGWCAWHQCGRMTNGERWRNLLAAFSWPVLAGIFYLPWSVVMLQQRHRVQEQYWISPFSWESVPRALYLQVFQVNDVGDIQNRWIFAGSQLVLAFAVVLVVICLVRGSRDRAIASCPAILGIAPVLMAMIVSLVSVSVMESRHLSFCFPFLIALSVMAVHWLLPRRAVIAVMALFVAWGSFGTIQFLDSLRTSERGGIRSAAEWIRSFDTGGQMIVVRHPCLYHALDFYLGSRNRLKLWLPAGLPRHYFGRPLIREEDLISAAQLEALPQSTLVSVDTNGFSGDLTFPFPDCWQPEEASKRWFRDVASFQGYVTVKLWRRLPADANAVPGSVLGPEVVRADDHSFEHSFAAWAYDNRWFTLQTGGHNVRPMREGFLFPVPVSHFHKTARMSFRSKLHGDFEARTAWRGFLSGQRLDTAIDFRCVPAAESGRDVLVSCLLKADGSGMELSCGAARSFLALSANDNGQTEFCLCLERMGGHLVAKLESGGQSVQVEARMPDRPVALWIGDATVIAPAIMPGAAGGIQTGRGSTGNEGDQNDRTGQNTTAMGADAGFVLRKLEVRAERISYASESSAPDITIPPSPRFWGCWSVLLAAAVICSWMVHSRSIPSQRKAVHDFC